MQVTLAEAGAATTAEPMSAHDIATRTVTALKLNEWAKPTVLLPAGGLSDSREKGGPRSEVKQT
jgi:hypothetical protein